MSTQISKLRMQSAKHVALAQICVGTCAAALHAQISMSGLLVTYITLHYALTDIVT